MSLAACLLFVACAAPEANPDDLDDALPDGAAAPDSGETTGETQSAISFRLCSDGRHDDIWTDIKAFCERDTDCSYVNSCRSIREDGENNYNCRMALSEMRNWYTECKPPGWKNKRKNVTKRIEDLWRDYLHCADAYFYDCGKVFGPSIF